MKGVKPLENCEYAMTYSEIGRELGITKQAVREIQARALRKIAHKLEGYRGYEQHDGEVRLAYYAVDRSPSDSW